jgi:hypothetical protein
MVWPSPAQGIRPYAPRTGQIVYIVVTPSLGNSIFCSLCFQSLAHSFAASFFATPLQSAFSALFAKNTGGGYTPQNSPHVFKDLRTLADFVHAGLLIEFRFHKLPSFSLFPKEQEIRAWRSVSCFSRIMEHRSRNTTLIRAFQSPLSALRAFWGKFVFSVAFRCFLLPSMSRWSPVVFRRKTPSIPFPFISLPDFFPLNERGYTSLCGNCGVLANCGEFHGLIACPAK